MEASVFRRPATCQDILVLPPNVVGQIVDGEIDADDEARP